MNARLPAEIFPPGEFLREELEARGWTQQELADILGRPPRLICEIISAKRSVTPETAKGLAQAFGTSPEYWMNLESQYQLSKVKTSSDEVAKRARLYNLFPVREMIRRGWIFGSDNVDVLESRFCEFFRIPDIAVSPSLNYAAKKTDQLADTTSLQAAWLFRVLALAEQNLVMATYSPKKLEAAVKNLNALLGAPEEVRHVQKILSEAGVRLIFVQALPGSKIDGATFWLDEKSPVIGMTLRFDRIDNFWFVLRHEIEHVLREDGKADNEFIVDNDAGSETEGISACEIAANNAAAEFCVPQAQLNDFIARVQPAFSEQRVMLFAQRIGVHPGLVVGQLQRRLSRYNFLHKHLVSIRQFAIQSGNADGWGTFSD